MTSKRQRAASAIALLLIFSLSQVYVQANLTKSLVAKDGAAAATPARSGKLTTRGSNPISVNGNRTLPGTTVLSGSQIQTPANVGASVQLGRLGVVRLAPETSLTLKFDDASVDVVLESGYATLTTGAGVRGSLTTPDGKTEHTNSATGSTVSGQTDQEEEDKNKKKKGGVYIPGSGEEVGTGVLGGLSTHAATVFGVIVLGGAVTAALIESNRDNGAGTNVSPFRP